MNKFIPAFFSLFAISASISASTYYISPGGSDIINNGLSVASPFQTIQKAASVMTAGDTCQIRAGVYRETVMPANSGAPGAAMTFAPYNNESVTVTGCDLFPVTWSVYSGSIYQASTADNFIQLFVDSHMMNEARWPNTATDDLLHMVSATAIAATNDTAISCTSLPPGNWVGAYMWIQPGDGWGSYTRQITAYSAGSWLSWSSPIGTGDVNYQPRPGNQFYIFGSLSGLDTAGEWFLDTAGQKLYLWTPNSTTPAGHTVEIKKRDYAFDLSARSYITLYNLNIFSSAINMSGSNYCTVDDCSAMYVDHYTRANGYSVSGGENNYMSGTNNEWKNSTITYSAGCGIYIQGAYNKVTNCLIHDTGYMGSNHGAIMTEGAYGAQTFGHVLSRNTIYNTGRFGIYHPVTRDIKILYNDISQPGLVSKDCGAIYAYGLDAQYTEIAYNWTHDNYTTYGAGVYMDNGSNHHLVHHNVAWNCAGTGIVLNTPSEYNLVYNNTIFSCNKSFDYYGNAAQGLGDPESQLGSEVINNIAQNPMTFSHNPPATNNHNGNYPIDANFMPSTGSGAIDAGVVIPGITDGYLGSAPDIGAYEYGGFRWVPGYAPPTATATPGGPVFTPTMSSTVTATPTITMTIPYIPGNMVDNFSDCNNINNFGGAWSSNDDSGSGGVSWISPKPFAASAPGYGAVDCAANVSGLVKYATGGDQYPEIDLTCDLNGNTDLSNCVGLRFMFKGDNKYYSVRLLADAGINTGYNDYKCTFFAQAGWQYVILPFSGFSQAPGWGNVVALGTVLAKVRQIVFLSGTYPPPGNQYSVNFSVDNLEVYGCGLATPTLTPTTTPTKSFLPPQSMIDDCNNGSTNLWNGYWYTGNDNTQSPVAGVSTVWPPIGNFSMSAPGYDSAGFAARLTGTVKYATGGYAYPYVDMGTNLSGVFDMTSCGGLRFWYKNDGRQYYVKMPCDASVPTGYNYYRFTLPASASWTQISIPFLSFTQATGWGVIADWTAFFQKITGVEWQTDSFPAQGAQWNVDLWVDNIEIYGCPGVPTYGPSPTCSRTVTKTPTVVTATLTATATFTDTLTFTLTPSVTMTITGTPPTITVTPTITETETSTVTPTITQTSSITVTPTVTPTITQTCTGTITPTVSATITATYTRTITPTHSVTATITRTMIATATETPVAQTADLTVKDVRVYPNPYEYNAGNDMKFAYRLTKDTDSVSVKIYSCAFRCVLSGLLSAGQPAGPRTGAVVADKFKNLGNGIYYYIIEAETGGKKIRSSAGCVLILK